MAYKTICFSTNKAARIKAKAMLLKLVPDQQNISQQQNQQTKIKGL